MRHLSILAIALGLSACGDPLAGVGRLADVDVADTDPAAAALPDADELAREGFIGTSAAEGAVPPEAAPSKGEPAQQTGGFFSTLFRRAADDDVAATTGAQPASRAAPQDAPAQASVELAALTGPAQGADAGSQRRGLGLFGGFEGKPANEVSRSGPDARDVPFGTVLAFGEIARVCAARGKSLGRKVESNGRRGFELYDSKPDIVDKRTFYITGFDDNCPRQFTAANALFGAPSFYEQIRFSPAGAHLPTAVTDEAYDKVKSTVCRAAKTKPCGTKISTLDRNTAFVSAYEFGEHNGKWTEFLVHDGRVIAGAMKAMQ